MLRATARATTKTAKVKAQVENEKTKKEKKGDVWKKRVIGTLRPNDIVCGRALTKTVKNENRPAYQEFRKMIMALSYDYCESHKEDKKKICTSVLNRLEELGYRFVDWNDTRMEWFQIPRPKTMLKIAQAFRDQKNKGCYSHAPEPSLVWKMRIADLKEFRRDHGHCRVPSEWPENVLLSRWVKIQRQQYQLHQKGEKNSLTPIRIQQLKNLDFYWGTPKPVAQKIYRPSPPKKSAQPSKKADDSTNASNDEIEEKMYESDDDSSMNSASSSLNLSNIPPQQTGPFSALVTMALQEAESEEFEFSRSPSPEVIDCSEEDLDKYYPSYSQISTGAALSLVSPEFAKLGYELMNVIVQNLNVEAINSKEDRCLTEARETVDKQVKEKLLPKFLCLSDYRVHANVRKLLFLKLVDSTFDAHVDAVLKAKENRQELAE